MKLLLARHGETAWNAEGRYQGQSDIPLSEVGEKQARALGATTRQLHWTLVGEARAGVLLAIATAFSRSISEVGAVLLVGGNIKGHTRVLTTAIILETSQGAFGFAIGLGVVLLAIALAANLLMIRWLRRTPR